MQTHSAVVAEVVRKTCLAPVYRASSSLNAPAGVSSQSSDLRTVLIVDDDPQVVHVTRFILQRAGFRVLTATCAEQGLHLAISHYPDVILCDAALPRIQGSQVLRILKSIQATASIPVILVSGHEGLDCDGVFTFLRKPFDTDTLVSATRNALQQHQQAA